MRSDALYNNYVHHLFYRIKQIQWPATLLQIQNLPIPHTRNVHPTALTLEGMKSLQVISHFDFPGNEQWMYICKAACVICYLHLKKKMYNRRSKIVRRCTCFMYVLTDRSSELPYTSDCPGSSRLDADDISTCSSASSSTLAPIVSKRFPVRPGISWRKGERLEAMDFSSKW